MNAHKSKTLNLTQLGSLLVRGLLISMGLLMSLNVVAKDKDYVTPEQLNAAISAAVAAEATARDAAIGTAVAAEVTARNAAISAAVSELQAQIERLTYYIAGGTYAIGDTGPADGIVFYVTDGGLHGLEAAPQDQVSAAWGCYGTEIPGADGTAVGTGAQNTADILAGCATRPIAASVADAYELNGYSDWYLPSKDELDLMYDNIGPGAPAPNTNVGGFAWDFYWSSTEGGGLSAWLHYFSIGSQLTNGKLNARRVRAVRAF